ncbi:hypothetical protein WR25_05013 [Diploscapter pachys]|uniref:Membralin n=1 Tax=Diploscapter pachys TaxID=2018661 RepID=A0A2A2J5J7_9BILA|nr:hypothetical protein WR25_05013 [Diploscapter pachys]
MAHVANDHRAVDISIDVNFPISANFGLAALANSPTANTARNNANQPAQEPPIFVVRERLFLTIMQRLAATYERKVTPAGRRVIEMLFLISAIALLMTLMFIHVSFARTNNRCFENVTLEWMNDGVLRVEVVKNLPMLEYQERWVQWYISERSKLKCHFSPADVLRFGPRSLPAELRAKEYPRSNPKMEHSEERPPPKAPFESRNSEKSDHDSLLSLFLRAPAFAVANVNSQLESDENEQNEAEEQFQFYRFSPLEAEAYAAFREEFYRRFEEDDAYQTLYQAEFSLIFGVLRLPHSYRERHNIKMVSMRIDADSECFGDAWARYSLKYFIGYEESVSASLRGLAVLHNKYDPEGRRNLGYLHDLRTHEHYHFVTLTMTKSSYIVAFAIMAVFTFAISMLLRFSHHQIFIIIYDFLHWFESNQPMTIPMAPLLTVILALVGMEAIMSEIFNDTSTAFYIILVVWVADQFDAVCCRTPISKKFWLKFFYLYQFFFYAYQYRFGGQYSGLALLTSALFIMHSMVYFFHHYEMPYILHQERIQRIMNDVGSVPPMGPVDIRAVSVRISGSTDRPAQPQAQNGVDTNNSRSEPMPVLPEVLESTSSDAAGEPTQAENPQPIAGFRRAKSTYSEEN